MRWVPVWVLSAVLLLVGCGGGSVSEGAGALAPEAPGAIWFVESAAESGLEFVHRSGHRERFLFPEIVSGGAALFDADGDGDLDAYLVQSGSITDPFSEAAENRLFLNDGTGRFVDRTDGSGSGDRGYGMGVTSGDYDGDGDVDLYVTNFGPNALLRNEGGGRFVDVAEQAGVADPGWGLGSTFVDIEPDGDLDLFVANYVNWSIRAEVDCYSSTGNRDYCLPTNYQAPAMDRLFRNDGNGRFTDISREAGFATAFGNGMGVVAEDFDGDGRMDLFVANDTMMNQLWMNVDGTKFVDEALLRGCALDEHGMTKAGMGVESIDIDDDGDPDLLVVNLEGQTDSFFVNDGGIFADRTGSLGLGAASRSYTRFGVGLVDFDNDGRLDLYLANGKVTQSGHHVGEDPFAEPNLLLHGDGQGGLREVSPIGGTAEPIEATSRAAAFGDVDGDGGVDVLVVNKDGPAHLMLNRRAGRGNWIGIDARDEAGAPALGARVEIDLGDRTLTRRVRSTFSYCAASDPRIHLGLGDRTQVDAVRVFWSDGTATETEALAAGRYHRIDRAGNP